MTKYPAFPVYLTHCKIYSEIGSQIQKEEIIENKCNPSSSIRISHTSKSTTGGKQPTPAQNISIFVILLM